MEDFFRLGLIGFTTPQVIAEITNDEQWEEIYAHINNGQLIIDNTGEYEMIIKIAEQHAALSIADSSVLELAIRKDAIILTSDSGLRKISITKNVKVRGMLWLIEELYLKRIIAVELALQKLQMYNEINTRAPFKEIENLIKKLKQM